jgi:hypothetical protein
MGCGEKKNSTIVDFAGIVRLTIEAPESLHAGPAAKSNS